MGHYFLSNPCSKTKSLVLIDSDFTPAHVDSNTTAIPEHMSIVLLKLIIHIVLEKKFYVQEVTMPTIPIMKYLKDFTREHTLQTVMTVEFEVTSTHNIYLVRRNVSKTELRII